MSRIKQITDVLDAANYRMKVIGNENGIVVSVPPNRFLTDATRHVVMVFEVVRGDEPGLRYSSTGEDERFFPMGEFAVRTVLTCAISRIRIAMGYPAAFTRFETVDGEACKDVVSVLPAVDDEEIERERLLMDLLDVGMDDEFTEDLDREAELAGVGREFQLCKHFYRGED
jgi:hypothetical protein